MSALAIAITLALLSIGLSIATLAEMCRIARRMDELDPGPFKISGDIPPLDMQTLHHIAGGNTEAIIWYENSRRNPPRRDGGEPVNA